MGHARYRRCFEMYYIIGMATRSLSSTAGAGGFLPGRRDVLTRPHPGPRSGSFRARDMASMSGMIMSPSSGRPTVRVRLWRHNHAVRAQATASSWCSLALG
jgi:hypothetical protein